MPRLSRQVIPALDDLVRQQRYTPAKALLRQMARAEALAQELDPDRAYPEDWIVFRITGFRGAPTGDDPALIPGQALRDNLSALVEHLSDAARLSPEAVGEPCIDLAALSARWNVSRKTIERYRRQGLIARRTRDARGHVRLVFSERAVRWFEANRAATLQRAGARDRIDDRTRHEIARRAARYHSRLGWTLNQAAGRLALRFGRGRETVRQVLIRHDEAAAAPIFHDDHHLGPHDRRIIVRAYERGVRPSRIAARIGCSRATVHRTINQRRADRLRRIPLLGPSHEAFASLSGASLILTHPAAAILEPLPRFKSVSDFIAHARSTRPTDGAFERARAAALCMLRWRATTAAAEISRRWPRWGELDRAETDLRWAIALEQRLIASECPLVLRAIEERLGSSLADVPRARGERLVSLALAAAADGVRRFDPFHGGRLAAPVSLAINRALVAESSDGDAPMPGLPAEPWHRWILPDPRLEQHRDLLDTDTAAAMAVRFGWPAPGGEQRPPLTLVEVHDKTGLSPARWTALWRHAMRTIRAHPNLRPSS